MTDPSEVPNFVSFNSCTVIVAIPVLEVAGSESVAQGRPRPAGYSKLRIDRANTAVESLDEKGLVSVDAFNQILVFHQSWVSAPFGGTKHWCTPITRANSRQWTQPSRENRGNCESVRL